MPARVALMAMPDALSDAADGLGRRPQTQDVFFQRGPGRRVDTQAQALHAAMLARECHAPHAKVISTGIAPSPLELHLRRTADMPGPGAYQPKLDSVVARVRSVSLKTLPPTPFSAAAAGRARRPGPGSYDAPATAIDAHTGALFTRSRRNDLLREVTGPGPGAYDDARSLDSRGGKMCPVPSADVFKQRRGSDRPTPGPDHYAWVRPSTTGGRIVSQADRESSESRERRLRTKDPGPGHYGGHAAASRAGPKMSNARRPSAIDLVVARASQIPGPASYVVPPLPRAPAAVKYEQPRGFREERPSPGPGEYDAPALSGDSAMSMSGLHPSASYIAVTEARARLTPGPGAYHFAADAGPAGTTFSVAPRGGPVASQGRRPGSGAADAHAPQADFASPQTDDGRGRQRAQTDKDPSRA
ncbi:hypothetical protein M885DRAFT_509387 [Pelagophyceae sp. CCMP2097]|nr:hypothetical protein M885DRAFT_509387 [Pelagophyceae sp. CCMP2097]